METKMALGFHIFKFSEEKKKTTENIFVAPWQSSTFLITERFHIQLYYSSAESCILPF